MVTAVGAKLLYCACHGDVGMIQRTPGGWKYESSRRSTLLFENGKLLIQKESNPQMHVLVVDID